MAVNPPKSRILPTYDGYSWRCGPALHPLKDIFSGRIWPLDPEDHILSQKLLVDISDDMFTSKNWPWQAKSTRPVLFSKHRFFLPVVKARGPHHCLTAFSPWRQCLFYCWSPWKSLYVADLHRPSSNPLVASDLHGNWGIAHPDPSFTPLLGPPPIDICLSSS